MDKRRLHVLVVALTVGTCSGGTRAPAASVRQAAPTVVAAPATATVSTRSLSGYVTGDFHQHTTFTDGKCSFDYQMARNNQFGLDWWANSESGGAFNRDGRQSGTGADPLNQTVYFDQLPDVKILGNNLTVSGGHTNMWRWQSVRDYSFPALTNARAAYPSKVLIQGYEWNVPGAKPAGAGGSGHEHCSMGTVAGEFGADASANVVAQFEYQFDLSDGDTVGGAAQGWTKSAYANTDDAKMVEAAAWLQANYGAQSWLIPAHPERRKNWNVQTLRRLNDAAPDVAFGFESLPGHQRSPSRGEYNSASVGGSTYGGCGIYAAKVGGVWDALLGEGRKYWLFSSSDSQDTNAGDFFPGEYQKTYTCVTDRSDAAAIVAGLRSGNSWVVEGDLIDGLDFRVGSAGMGGVSTTGGPLATISITVHDPAGSNWGVEGHNTPVLNHIDVIAGDVRERIAANDPAYTNEVNTSTRVIARFDAVGGQADVNRLMSTAWTDMGDGVKRMTLVFDTQGRKMYFRLRGSNQAVGGAETDGAGNPLPDAPGMNTAVKAWDDLWFYSNPIFVDTPMVHTLTVTADADGAVTPATVRVTHGCSTNFVILASDYHHIGDVRTNGVSVGGVSGLTVLVYTWSSVVTDGVLAVDFAQNLAPGGTPETWLAEHGLAIDEECTDKDGDGMRACDEYVAGTDPSDGMSVLKITEAGLSDASGFKLQWPSVAGRTYDVEYGTNLLDEVPFQPVLTDIKATPSTNICLVPAPPSGQHFFRLKVRMAQ